MKVAISTTNVFISGIECPYGWGELPIAGSIDIVAPWGMTNLSVDSGDVLVIGHSDAQIVEGLNPFAAFVGGFSLLTAIAIVGLARRYSRMIAADSRADI